MVKQQVDVVTGLTNGQLMKLTVGKWQFDEVQFDKIGS